MTLQPIIAPSRVAEGGARVKESVVDGHLAKNRALKTGFLPPIAMPLTTMIGVAIIVAVKSIVPFLNPIGTPLIVGTASSTVVLILATAGWLIACHSRQRSDAAMAQLLLPTEATPLFNQHKDALPRAAGMAAATGGCKP